MKMNKTSNIAEFKVSNHDDNIGVYILLQNKKKTTVKKMKKQIDAFIESSKTKVKSMSDKDFKNLIGSIKELLTVEA